MRASEYNRYWKEDNPVKDKMTDFLEEYPCDNDTMSELPWNENEQVEFIEGIEKEASINFTDEELSIIFSPEITIGEFQCLLKEACINKYGKITSMQQRAKMRAYRMENRGTLSLKSKQRQRKIKQGVHIQKKRVGTAAGGYSFIMSGPRTNVANSSKGSSISFTGVSPGIRTPKHFKS